MLGALPDVIKMPVNGYVNFYQCLAPLRYPGKPQLQFC
jgi:hypothetical protein